LGWQVCTLTGHTDTVSFVAFSRDGTRIVSGSADHLLKIWDAGSGAEVSILE
jgi:WD40 repeat protein